MNQKPNTRASSLRHLITFERLTGVVDNTTGGLNDSWVVAFQARAAKYEFDQTFTAQEEQRDHVTASSRTVQFRVRFRSDIDTTMRVKLGTQVYRIRSVVEVGHREWTDVICAEYLNE
jgi:SPP1 family predicted phage head-tail adaptor